MTRIDHQANLQLIFDVRDAIDRELHRQCDDAEAINLLTVAVKAVQAMLDWSATHPVEQVH